jgi:hypothetical protein
MCVYMCVYKHLSGYVSLKNKTNTCKNPLDMQVYIPESESLYQLIRTQRWDQQICALISPSCYFDACDVWKVLHWGKIIAYNF